MNGSTVIACVAVVLGIVVGYLVGRMRSPREGRLGAQLRSMVDELKDCRQSKKHLRETYVEQCAAMQIDVEWLQRAVVAINSEAEYTIVREQIATRLRILSAKTRVRRELTE